MGLFSFFRKNKQQPNSEQSAYHSRSEEDTSAIRASRKRKTANNQANDAADPVLPEKKRARRRLVGAIALVLAVVIVLPMVLDSEPKPLADDIAIQIPSHDKPASASASASAAASGAASNVSGLDQQEEIIDPASTPAPSANVKPGAAPVPPLANNANVAVPIAPQTEPEIKPEPKPVAKPKPENKPKAELKQERKPKLEPKSEPKSEVKAEETPDVSEPQDDAARAAAILNGRSDVARPAAGKFVIQVAALASQEKVDELRGKLSDAGIRSYTQKIKTSSGDRIRIRVGPFASKEEAEKARARLAALGLSGSLVPA